MTKYANDLIMDAALDYIANNASTMTACSSAPSTYLQATSTYALADVTIDSGDFTKADGDAPTYGRKTTIAAQNGVTIDVSGTATHVAITKTSGSVLLYVTTCDSLALTAGQTMNFSAWDIQIGDPT